MLMMMPLLLLLLGIALLIPAPDPCALYCAQQCWRAHYCNQRAAKRAAGINIDRAGRSVDDERAAAADVGFRRDRAARRDRQRRS